MNTLKKNITLIIILILLISISSCTPESTYKDDQIENTQATGDEDEHIDETEKG